MDWKREVRFLAIFVVKFVWALVLTACIWAMPVVVVAVIWAAVLAVFGLFA